MAKHKYSADERAWAIENGNYALYKKARYELLKEDHLEFLHSKEYWAHMNLPDYDVCRCLWRSSYARGYRLRKRLEPMIMLGAWFITLTFRPAVLDSTSPKTRRVYVREFLKGIAAEFVANKDFGEKNEREHYHAVISLLLDDSCLSLVHDAKGAHAVLPGWEYGFSNWERIGKHDGGIDDLVAVSKYLSKLQNHALKATASDETMIYSRRKK